MIWSAARDTTLFCFNRAWFLTRPMVLSCQVNLKDSWFVLRSPVYRCTSVLCLLAWDCTCSCVWETQEIPAPMHQIPLYWASSSLGLSECLATLFPSLSSASINEKSGGSARKLHLAKVTGNNFMNGLEVLCWCLIVVFLWRTKIRFQFKCAHTPISILSLHHCHRRRPVGFITNMSNQLQKIRLSWTSTSNWRK